MLGSYPGLTRNVFKIRTYL